MITKLGTSIQAYIHVFLTVVLILFIKIKHNTRDGQLEGNKGKP